MLDLTLGILVAVVVTLYVWGSNIVYSIKTKSFWIPIVSLVFSIYAILYTNDVEEFLYFVSFCPYALLFFRELGWIAG